MMMMKAARLFTFIAVVLCLGDTAFAKLGEKDDHRELVPGCTGCPCITDVVIVGAGFAGLAAAKTLKDAAEKESVNLVNFVILESSADHVGGRVKSAKEATTGLGKTVEGESS